MNIKSLIDRTEKVFLALIALFTVVAMGQEALPLIILQGKETDPVVLIHESGAVLLISAAAWVITRMRRDD